MTRPDWWQATWYESRRRIAELADSLGCEAAAERAWHEGRLSVLDVFGDTIIAMTEPEETEAAEAGEAETAEEAATTEDEAATPDGE